ncbi:MAG: HD domain-containing protein [Candidatus Hodarchaeota archaeon]
MQEYVQKTFQEQLKRISDSDLREKVIRVIVEAMKEGGWDTMDIPFTLLIPNLDVTYAQHVRIVTTLAVQAGELHQKNGVPVKMDVLVASALLHDVGKLVEYKRTEDKVETSDAGKRLRHPAIGSALALKHGLSYEIAQNIYQHSWEGERGPKRTPEGHILHNCDFLHFEPLKTYLESK